MDFFGASVSAVGDVNNDGRKDVIVGAVYHDGPAGFDSGKAYVFGPVSAGDFDCDEKRDLQDYPAFVACLRGGNIPPMQTECRWADLNGNDRVDLRDFADFQVIFGEER